MNDNTATCITVTALMKRWRCTRKSIIEAIDRGDLKAFRIAKKAYRITIVEVERFEQESVKAKKKTEAA